MKEQIVNYLADEMEAKEREQFENELLSNNELKQELYEAACAWEISGTERSVRPEFNSSSAWNNVSKSLTSERSLVPQKTGFSFLKIAASLVLVAALGYLGIKTTGLIEGESEEITHHTAEEIEKHLLPDGSVVMLNANSSITYEEGFGDKHRNIVLKGAANFDVHRNEDLPFLISAENSEIKVLGTSFEVRAYANEPVEVNVASGSVGFASTKTKNAPAILKAGEKATLSTDGTQIKKAKLKNENYSGWWTKKLVFDNTKLSEVVKDLEKAYWVDIELADSMKDCPLTLIVNSKNLDGALEILSSTYVNMTITRDKENRIKLDGKGCTD